MDRGTCIHLDYTSLNIYTVIEVPSPNCSSSIHLCCKDWSPCHHHLSIVRCVIVISSSSSCHSLSRHLHLPKVPSPRNITVLPCLFDVVRLNSSRLQTSSSDVRNDRGPMDHRPTNQPMAAVHCLVLLCVPWPCVSCLPSEVS